MEYLYGACAHIVCKFIRIRIIKMEEPTESNGVGNRNHNGNKET